MPDKIDIDTVNEIESWVNRYANDLPRNLVCRLIADWRRLQSDHKHVFAANKVHCDHLNAMYAAMGIRYVSQDYQVSYAAAMRTVCDAADAVVASPMFRGICDEDVLLEQTVIALRKAGGGQ